MNQQYDAADTPNQRIFEMGLSVEAVSLYLLCRALRPPGTPVTAAQVDGTWNGNRDQLRRAVEELVRRGVLAAGDGGDYRLRPDTRWMGAE